VPIIRRNNCIYATLGTCHSVWMTVWYAGWNKKNGVGVFSSVERKYREIKGWILRGHRKVILSVPDDIWATNSTYVHCCSSPCVARITTRVPVDSVSPPPVATPLPGELIKPVLSASWIKVWSKQRWHIHLHGGTHSVLSYGCTLHVRCALTLG
jgi:hypothetical protein